MSSALSASTSKPRPVLVGRKTPPSIRAVCLIGLARESPGRNWRAGDRLRCSGRVYQVEAMSRSPTAVYVHLAEPDESSD